MKKLLFSILCSCFVITSCNNLDLIEQDLTKESAKIIHTERIDTDSNLTRSEVNPAHFVEGYLCKSTTSSLNAEIFVSKDCKESYSYILDANGKVIHLLKFKIDSQIANKVCSFSAYNENNEPIMAGIYDLTKQQIEITQVYGNDSMTRASINAWGCNLTIGVIGGIWSTAAGVVSLGAGFVVGLTYTAMAIAMCDGL